MSNLLSAYLAIHLKQPVMKKCAAHYTWGGYSADCVGALCARDYKGVGTQYVNEGKLIVEVIE